MPYKAAIVLELGKGPLDEGQIDHVGGENLVENGEEHTQAISYQLLRKTGFTLSIMLGIDLQARIGSDCIQAQVAACVCMIVFQGRSQGLFPGRLKK